jgi:hypothetical protein
MAKFKLLNENQLVMLPFSLQVQLVPGILEHTISELVENHLYLSVFDAHYNNDETGTAAIHPKILLKVILLAYARGMISSRQLNAPLRKTSSSLPSPMAMPQITARLLHLFPQCKARSRPSSAMSCWCVKNWDCSTARTSAWMGEALCQCLRRMERHDRLTQTQAR